MASNNKIISLDNMEEWLCSTGFLLPRNDLELARFERLYGGMDESLTGKEIDPEKIIRGELKKAKVIILNQPGEIMPDNEYKMVARNGSPIPNHILEKMRKNHSKGRNSNDNGTTTEGNK